MAFYKCFLYFCSAMDNDKYADMNSSMYPEGF